MPGNVQTIRLAETFTSIQGEGSEAGVPMHFIRLAGCSVATCPLHPASSGHCDTDWSYKFSKNAEELIAEIPRGIHWLSITGGEPTDQMPAVEELVRLAHRRKMRVNLQTSGIRAVRTSRVFDWLTVSPKCGDAADLQQKDGHELKLVYTGQSLDELRDWRLETRFHHYYLLPLWIGDACNIRETAAVVMKSAEAGMPWRLSLQSHKYAGVR